MLDQSFSTQNFRRIFDYQNRRGIYLESDFFPEVAELTSKIKECKHELKLLAKKESLLSPKEFSDRKEKLREKRQLLALKKEELLTVELQNVSKKVNVSGFNFPLTSFKPKDGKRVYRLEHEPYSYFACKQVQHNIKRLFGVKQGNRNEIIPQLKNILSDTFPKIIVKTDIKNFYESIPRENIIRMLSEGSLLTAASKKIIRQLLHSYQKHSGVGLPRGLGVSAYLSELYLRRLDISVKQHPHIIYYTRYVDDIIAIFASNPTKRNINYLEFIEHNVEELGLKLNENGKTSYIDLKQSACKSMDYLGYKFTFGVSDAKTDFTKKRLNRYKEKIDAAFAYYNKKSVANEKAARKLLVKRVRYLTSNTRLKNNKKNALIGIFYSNSHITSTVSLVALDKYLSYKISHLRYDRLKIRLSRFSFVDGFRFKRFCPYTLKELSAIVSVWSND